MATFNTLSPATLMRLVGTPQAPVLIDVRIDDDFSADPFLIPGARRWPHDRIAGLAPGLAGRAAVIICQKGRKLSQGAAALLRCHGVPATVLDGGSDAWRDASLPRIPCAAIAADWQGGPTLWVTRQRPRIDRIACPWLIRRFVDPEARFLYVAADEVAGVAARFGAIAFDTAGAPWTHAEGKCTFDALVDGLGLGHPPLDRLARLVRATDTGDHAADPVAPGLLALSVGLSRAHKDDLAQLDAGLPLYDALYRWARDGADETHGWPGNHA